MRQRKPKRKLSNMNTMLGWPRLRTPLGPRSLLYVGLSVNWYGMKPSIKPGLRLLIYYPPAIRPKSSLDFKADPVSSEAGEIQGSPTKAPLVANTSLKGAKQAEDTTKAGDVTKEGV